MIAHNSFYNATLKIARYSYEYNYLTSNGNGNGQGNSS